MSDVMPLSAEERARSALAHVPVKRIASSHCRECGMLWPCRESRLLATCDALERERDGARAALSSTQRRIKEEAPLLAMIDGNNGRWLLRMIRGHLTHEAFVRGLRLSSGDVNALAAEVLHGIRAAIKGQDCSQHMARLDKNEKEFYAVLEARAAQALPALWWSDVSVGGVDQVGAVLGLPRQCPLPAP